MGSVITQLNYLIDSSPQKVLCSVTLTSKLRSIPVILGILFPPPRLPAKDHGIQAENHQPLCQALLGVWIQSSPSQSPVQQGALTVVRHCSRLHSQLLSAMNRTLLKGSTWDHMGRTPKSDLELKKDCWRNRPLSHLSHKGLGGTIFPLIPPVPEL